MLKHIKQDAEWIRTFGIHTPLFRATIHRPKYRIPLSKHWDILWDCKICSPLILLLRLTVYPFYYILTWGFKYK